MKPHFLLFLFPAFLAVSSEAAQPDARWNTLTKGGKGVALTKFHEDGGEYFIFFAGTNSKQLSSGILLRGLRFSSLEEAAKFVRQRPSDTTLFPADLDLIEDDRQAWRPFSSAERTALSEALRSSPAEAKKPNKAPEPTTTAVTSPAAQETRQP